MKAREGTTWVCQCAKAGTYAFALGARVQILRGFKAGECGTVEAISRTYEFDRPVTYGVAIPNRGGLYYYQAHELKGAP